METKVIARKIGGSIAVFIPKNIIEIQKIVPHDIIRINIHKTGDFDFMWGKGKNIKKSTDEIMKEIDEGED